ncbi:hypothetical protein ACFQGX_15595 [Nonomuraea dietziae]|uniref:hypothetical protein n=1 Tax=Nonomuraea dietziae TaxID=65515 RepID=UPI0036234120
MIFDRYFTGDHGPEAAGVAIDQVSSREDDRPCEHAHTGAGAADREADEARHGQHRRQHQGGESELPLEDLGECARHLVGSGFVCDREVHCAAFV